jgi:hypothetical protein
MGWWEIIVQIEDTVDKELNAIGDNTLPTMKENGYVSVIESKVVPDVIAHLENAYDAKNFGVDYDRFGLKILTIKAAKLAHTLKDDLVLGEVLNDETKSVDFLMSHYVKSVESGSVKSFMEKLGYKKSPGRAILT